MDITDAEWAETQAVRRRKIDAFFIPQNTDTSKNESHISPSGKYELTIGYYKTRDGYWGYSKGVVKNTKDGTIIADVKRNYSSFPLGWVENHSDGHDYLLCNEDYQGQTVIQLDTGKRLDFLPQEVAQGMGFCRVSWFPSPDRKVLAVEGCYWGAPYEIVVFDFSKPMELPYKELVRADLPYDSEIKGWEGGKIRLVKERMKHSTTGTYSEDETKYWEEVENCECGQATDDMHVIYENWETHATPDELLTNNYTWTKIEK